MKIPMNYSWQPSNNVMHHPQFSLDGPVPGDPEDEYVYGWVRQDPASGLWSTSKGSDKPWCPTAEKAMASVERELWEQYQALARLFHTPPTESVASKLRDALDRLLSNLSYPYEIHNSTPAGYLQVMVYGLPTTETFPYGDQLRKLVDELVNEHHHAGMVSIHMIDEDRTRKYYPHIVLRPEGGG